jgi:CBS domain containing-hemolysin-like protein
MLSTYFFAHLIDFGNAVWLEFVVITVLLTFLLLLFGEIIPKVYCGQHALAMCRRFCGGITFLRKLFYPVASVLIRSGIWASKVVQKESHVLSVDDLEQALELTDED